jgi:hypothetical protein
MLPVQTCSSSLGQYRKHYREGKREGKRGEEKRRPNNKTKTLQLSLPTM